MSWAIDRVAAKTKPSSATGPVKDCHLLGHTLLLTSLLSAAEYHDPPAQAGRWMTNSVPVPGPSL
jgi:hypothetical protein